MRMVYLQSFREMTTLIPCSFSAAIRSCCCLSIRLDTLIPAFLSLSALSFGGGRNKCSAIAISCRERVRNGQRFRTQAIGRMRTVSLNFCSPSFISSRAASSQSTVGNRYRFDTIIFTSDRTEGISLHTKAPILSGDLLAMINTSIVTRHQSPGRASLQERRVRQPTQQTPLLQLKLTFLRKRLSRLW